MSKNTVSQAGPFKVSEHWSIRTERMVYSVQAPNDPETGALVYLTTASGARRTWSRHSSAQAAADTANAESKEAEMAAVTNDSETEDFYLCSHCGAELEYSNDQTCEDCAEDDEDED